MKIRKFQYDINYIHILTFRESYKDIIQPFFGFDDLAYSIQNENTIHENIRLTFKNECMIILLRKEGISVLFEGNTSDVKKSESVIDIFFKISEKIKLIKGFHRIIKHGMTLAAVEIQDKDKYNEVIENNPYFTQNPFSNIVDFSCVYNFNDNGYDCKYEVGNYTPKDLVTREISPFKTEYNSDLMDGLGMMCTLDIKQDIDSASFSKFKNLLNYSEELINKFKLK